VEQDCVVEEQMTVFLSTPYVLEVPGRIFNP